MPEPLAERARALLYRLWVITGDLSIAPASTSEHKIDAEDAIARALAAVERAAPDGNPHCRPENHPDDCEPSEIRELADARAAIREAGEMLKARTYSLEEHSLQAWLALPAVVAATRTEGE